MTATLFAACVIPACGNPVIDAGRPCDECLGDFSHPGFGPMLARTGRPAPTAEQIEERDEAVRAVHRARREPERRANQVCWICDERHTCTREPQGWECATCREIQ